MDSSPPHSAAATVRSRYPSFCRQGTLRPLGNHGGFSGAVLWHIDSPAGPLALRAWPPSESWTRLLFRQGLMRQARANGLRFVPAIFSALHGEPAIEHAGRLWELTEWLPGCADFHHHPTAARLEAAATALAQLHAVWRSLPHDTAGCPAVRRRLAFLDDWHRLRRSGWQPLALPSDPLRPIVERAWHRLPTALEWVPHRLQRWLNANPPLQPCLCDPWHDHLLFEADRLSGLIDYGAVKIDSVAVDSARMLGSLVKDDEAGWQAGLQAYRHCAPLTAEEEELTRALDETGIVLSVANWLCWLYEEHRVFAARTVVARRLMELLPRLELLQL